MDSKAALSRVIATTGEIPEILEQGQFEPVNQLEDRKNSLLDSRLGY